MNPKKNIIIVVSGSETSKSKSVGIEIDVLSLKARFGQLDGITFMRIDHTRFSEETIIPLIKALRVEYGVTKLFFYYIGHARNSTADYPILSSLDGGVLLEDIHSLCMDVGFDMSVVGADCCDSILASSFLTKRGPITTPFTDSLFDATGHLLFSSSSLREPSYGDKNGGVFTTAFLNCFNGDWMASLLETKRRVRDITQNRQNPQELSVGFIQSGDTIHSVEEEPNFQSQFPFVSFS